MRRSAGCEADEIDEEREPVAASAGRHIDIDDALGRIAEGVALEDFTVDHQPVNGAARNVVISAHHFLLNEKQPRMKALKPRQTGA
jgi:hypothetical protein